MLENKMSENGEPYKMPDNLNLALYYYSCMDRFIMFMFLTLVSNPYVLNRKYEANNVINSLNCDGFDIGNRCSLNLPDLC